MIARNNTTLRTRAAIAALGAAWGKIDAHQRASLPKELHDATIELLTSLIAKAEPLPSPNQALILRAIYWLPDREGQEVVAALDELERLKNHG